MGIRIDAISRREFDDHYSWHLRAKGLHVEGVYFDSGPGSMARNSAAKAVISMQPTSTPPTGCMCMPVARPSTWSTASSRPWLRSAGVRRSSRTGTRFQAADRSPSKCVARPFRGFHLVVDRQVVLIMNTMAFRFLRRIPSTPIALPMAPVRWGRAP